MTALSDYQRLESGGIWRSDSDAQRRDVNVSFGDATLVISDQNNRPIAHWSLPAVERLNVGKRPAVFSPDGTDEETLEIEDDTMIDALEKVRKTVARRRPRPGRLRALSVAFSLGCVALLGMFWLPNAAVTHTVSVVPEVKRVEIGETLFENMTRITGPACRSGFALQALEQLRQRLIPTVPVRKFVVVASGVETVMSLPGNLIVLNAGLIEDHEDPAVVAGYVLTAQTAQTEEQKLRSLLEKSGLRNTFRLLTTGAIPDEALSAYSEILVTEDTPEPNTETVLSNFKSAEISATPYAYARDISGETTLDLIEADPYSTASPNPILTDEQWLQLQNICGS